jgi:hypothetical protein
MIIKELKDIDLFSGISDEELDEDVRGAGSGRLLGKMLTGK